MKIFIFILLISFVGCSKSPLFNTQNNNEVKFNQALAGQESLGSLNVGIQWISGPHIVSSGESIFKLRFWNPKTATIYGPYELPSQKVCVFLWMKMQDGSEHGSSPVVIETENNDDGDLLKIKDAYFVMNGIWQVRVRLVSPQTNCKSTKDFEFLDEVIFAARVD